MTFKSLSALVTELRRTILQRRQFKKYENNITLGGFMLTTPLVKSYEGTNKVSCVFTIAQINMMSARFKTFVLRTSSKPLIEVLTEEKHACYIVAMGKLTKNAQGKKQEFHIVDLKVTHEFLDYDLVKPRYKKGE